VTVYTGDRTYMLVGLGGGVTLYLTGALLGYRWTDQSDPRQRCTAPAGRA